MRTIAYVGKELELFRNAKNWKKYIADMVRPYIAGQVLEVGAGIGGTTATLCHDAGTPWTCLEPDKYQFQIVASLINRGALPSNCNAILGTIESIPSFTLYGTILYIDVLEHIDDAVKELQSAATHLISGGNLIVLAPAFQWLYSDFDKAIGHCRRYTMSSLKAITPAGLAVKKTAYLDSAGLLTSMANKWLLKKSVPTTQQISFWDDCLVRISRVTDPFFGYRLGRSILIVWSKG